MTLVVSDAVFAYFSPIRVPRQAVEKLGRVYAGNLYYPKRRFRRLSEGSTYEPADIHYSMRHHRHLNSVTA